MNEDTAPGSRLERQPVTVLHGIVLAACAFGFMLDILEVSFGNALAAVFSTPPHVADRAELAWLLASVYIGAAVGAPLLGWWADRRGRRAALVLAFLWMAAASLAGAMSRDIGELSACRGLLGLALGAIPPLVIALVTDLLPAGRRGPLLLTVIALGTLGGPAGVFLVRGLAALQPFGLEGWRAALMVGAFGALAAGLAFTRLPESPRWLAARGRTADADRSLAAFARSRPWLSAGLAPEAVASADDPASRGSPARLWPVVALLFFLSPWSTVAFPLLSGVLLAARGLRLQDSLLYVGLSLFGPLAGTLAMSAGVDRIGRRPAIACCAVAMLAAALAYVGSDAPAVLVATGALFGALASVYLSLLNIYGAELFPTRSRAVAISSAWACNRAGAAIAPLSLLPLLHAGGVAAMMGVIATAVVAGVLVLAVAPRGLDRAAVG